MNTQELKNELEIKKLEQEISLQQLDEQLKRKELKRNIVFQPTSVTLLLAVLSIIGAGITTILQRNNEITIEKQKYEYTIYEKALEAKDNITAAKVLDFYIKAGLNIWHKFRSGFQI